MNRSIVVIIASVILIAGCYSFNTYQFSTMTNSASNVTNKTTAKKSDSLPNIIPTAQATPLVVEKRCGAFQLPTLPSTPPLPYDELSKVTVADPDAIDRIQQKHIEELRDHIVKMKQAFIAAQKEHLTSCN